MQRNKPTKVNSSSRVRRRSIADRQDAPRSEHPLPAWSPFASEIIQRLRYTLTVSSGSSLYNRDVVLTVPDEDPALRGAGLPSPEADLPCYVLGDEPDRTDAKGSSRRLSAVNKHANLTPFRHPKLMWWTALVPGRGAKRFRGYHQGSKCLDGP